MILKEGKKYRTRCGLITGVMRKANNGTNYHFEAEVLEPQYSAPSVYSWLGDGTFTTLVFPHELDIIEEL